MIWFDLVSDQERECMVDVVVVVKKEKVKSRQRFNAFGPSDERGTSSVESDFSEKKLGLQKRRVCVCAYPGIGLKS
jgi:hypothetical protein